MKIKAFLDDVMGTAGRFICCIVVKSLALSNFGLQRVKLCIDVTQGHNRIIMNMSNYGSVLTNIHFLGSWIMLHPVNFA